MSQETRPGNAAPDAPVVVLGATSGIGALVVDEALRRGLPVRGFARSADQLALCERLEPVAGDARHPDDLVRAR